MTFYDNIKKGAKTALPYLFGGWDWLEHLMEVLDSNKGMIVKNLMIDKYLTALVDLVPGGSLMRLILEPFLTQYARQYDAQTKRAYQMTQQQRQQQKQRRIRLEAQKKILQQKLDNDPRVKQEKLLQSKISDFIAKTVQKKQERHSTTSKRASVQSNKANRNSKVTQRSTPRTKSTEIQEEEEQMEEQIQLLKQQLEALKKKTKGQGRKSAPVMAIKELTSQINNLEKKIT